MATLNNLPTELLIEILLRLPSRSLSSHKSVCKFWYALINDPTNYFLHHKYVFLKRRFMVNSGIYKCRPYILKFSLDLDRPISILNVKFPFRGDVPHFHICGHSHGLVCISFHRVIFLYNPTTREFHKLPPSILHYTGSRYESDMSFSNAVGFGYDSKSRNFKVVRIVEFANLDEETNLPARVEVYDLRKDRWREIISPICGRVSWQPAFEMHYEGTYYWWAYKDRGTNIIHSFDMSEEVFGEISIPNSVVKEREKYVSLGILNGKIVIFHYPTTGNQKTLDIWEMENDEYGVISWSKLLTISPIFGIERPLLFVRSDELLMETNEGYLIFYNIKTHRSKEIPINGPPSDFRATFFDNSLISVKGGNSIM